MLKPFTLALCVVMAAACQPAPSAPAAPSTARRALIRVGVVAFVLSVAFTLYALAR